MLLPERNRVTRRDFDYEANYLKGRNVGVRFTPYRDGEGYAFEVLSRLLEQYGQVCSRLHVQQPKLGPDVTGVIVRCSNPLHFFLLRRTEDGNWWLRDSMKRPAVSEVPLNEDGALEIAQKGEACFVVREAGMVLAPYPIPLRSGRRHSLLFASTSESVSEAGAVEIVTTKTQSRLKRLR
jgi:hypothetical protein